jgi:hypothetical protein
MLLWLGACSRFNSSITCSLSLVVPNIVSTIRLGAGRLVLLQSALLMMWQSYALIRSSAVCWLLGTPRKASAIGLQQNPPLPYPLLPIAGPLLSIRYSHSACTVPGLLADTYATSCRGTVACLSSPRPPVPLRQAQAVTAPGLYPNPALLAGRQGCQFHYVCLRSYHPSPPHSGLGFPFCPVW